jgi:hypothetical protein
LRSLNLDIVLADENAALTGILTSKSSAFNSFSILDSWLDLRVLSLQNRAAHPKPEADEATVEMEVATSPVTDSHHNGNPIRVIVARKKRLILRGSLWLRLLYRKSASERIERRDRRSKVGLVISN